jgi:hypothetical protein
MPTSRQPRPAERDYSHRTLIEKLGIKSGQRILVLEINDSNFGSEIAAFDPAFAEPRSSERFDVIMFGAEVKKALARLPKLQKHIVSNGAIWVVYPKGRTEIREIDVIAAKAADLVDNKICRFSDTHTAMRCVIPLAKRK